jgi:hypothetical protein
MNVQRDENLDTELRYDYGQARAYWRNKKNWDNGRLIPEDSMVEVRRMSLIRIFGGFSYPRCF